jgi:prepilin-type N-terminal cleavage/methylation domain-containing protein
MKTRDKSGFSLLEIMIVVTIIGFLAGLAFPAFMKARATSQKTRCIDNLRQIAGAKDQWAVENYANNGDTIPGGATAIAPFFKRGFPECPANGNYLIDVVGVDPSCSVGGGHTI